MRNKYTKEFENFVRENVSKYKKEDLRQILQNKFDIKISGQALRRYLNRHHIKDRYIDYMKNNRRNVYTSPIGTEKVTNEGVFIKVSQPDVWRRKTKVMYEKYHDCKLNDTDYVIFLNQDRNDFSKENLMKVSKQEMTFLYNGKVYSTNPKLTELGILSSKLKIKIKEYEENGRKRSNAKSI